MKRKTMLERGHPMADKEKNEGRNTSPGEHHLFDTILWEKESDEFSKRALKKFSTLEGLFNSPPRKKFISTIKNEFNKIGFIPKTILDIGCGTGGFLKLLHDQYKDSMFFGIDPGKISIGIAQEYFNKTEMKVNLDVGYSHKLKNEDISLDLVTLFKVLQWIPRKYLIKTIAEIDRVLKTNGFVIINEYLPYKPIFRQSKHNQDVYIFKQNYSKLFEIFPWYKIFYSITLNIDKDEDYVENLVILKKLPIQKVYHEGSNDDL
jgi:ubiquinone/menaquinone biosynthesis C-methylase UbiE